jgi:hypothetical protein
VFAWRVISMTGVLGSWSRGAVLIFGVDIMNQHVSDKIKTLIYM